MAGAQQDAAVQPARRAVQAAGHNGSIARLPPVLRAWSRIGRHFETARRLRISQRLVARGLVAGRAYRGAGNFAMEIDPWDPFQATMVLGIYDPLVEQMIHRFVRDGSVVIDAGAHLGYFSMRFARQVGPGGEVHAFECDPRLIERLRRHAHINGLSWLTVNDAGVSDRSSRSEQLYLPRQLGWSSVLAGAWGATEQVSVRMVSIDDYVEAQKVDVERLSFIKLDVEGSEGRAILGAREVLRAGSPAVLVEFIPQRLTALGHEPGELLSLMSGLGYAPWSPAKSHRGRLRLVPGVHPEVGEDVLFIKKGRMTTPSTEQVRPGPPRETFFR